MSLNNLGLGRTNSDSTVDLNNLKSGISRKDFESDAKSLALFDMCDSNKNSFLEDTELSLFKEKLMNFAGEDAVLDNSEMRKFLKEEQKMQAQEAQARQTEGNQQGQRPVKLKSEDLQNFVLRMEQLGIESTVTSSRVEGEQRIIEYEDGSQEVINKDGSKIITTISGGVKTVQTLNAEGKKVSEERTNDEDGSVETLLYGEDNKLQSHTKVKDGVTYEIGTEAPNYGRVMKETHGEGENQVVTTYSYTDDNNYVKTSKYQNTEKIEKFENGERTSTNTILYDENNQMISSVLENQDGTRIESKYENNKLVHEQIIDVDGNKRETVFNENGFRLTQTFTSKDGESFTAKYDGNGNTLVIVQNGETIGHLAQKFNISSSSIVAMNKDNVFRDSNGVAYFQVGSEVAIEGELPPTHKALKGRKSAEAATNAYVNTRVQQYANNANIGENDKISTTVTKNYTNWYHYAKDFLQNQEGVAEPSEAQITELSYALQSLNMGVERPTKGSSIVRLKTTAEHQADQVVAEQTARRNEQLNIANQFESERLSAFNAFQEGLKDDDIFADIADGIAHLWNNEVTGYLTGNTSSHIQSLFDKAELDNQALVEAAKKGDAAFAAKFKELYGVEYSSERINAYNAERQEYQRLQAVSTLVDDMTQSLDAISQNFSNASISAYMQGQQTGLSDMRKVDAEIFNLRNLMKEKFQFSDEFINGVISNIPSDVSTLEGRNARINYINQLTNDLKSYAQNYKNEVMGGVSLEDRKKQLDESYREAYGSKPNFEEIVPKYRRSQEEGGAAVKAGVEIAAYVAITAATAGAGSGVAAFLATPIGKGLTTAAISSGLDAISMATDGHEHTDEEVMKMLVKASVKGSSIAVGSAVGNVYKSMSAVAGTKANSFVSSLLQEEAKVLVTGGNPTDALTGAVLGTAGSKLGSVGNKALHIGDKSRVGSAIVDGTKRLTKKASNLIN